MGQALHDRPEVEEARLQLENSHIGLEGSRNELLPQLDLVASAQNAGLAGTANSTNPALQSAMQQSASLAGNIGGLGTGLGQVFSSRYPTYSVGIELTLPLHNRVAEADLLRDESMLRQWQVCYQQLESQVRLEVEGAMIAVNQAREAYAAASETRALQEQSVAIELEKYGVGLSTTALVLQYQSLLAQARSTEVAALDAYAKARTQLERALGQTLQAHDVSLDDAYRGRVTAAPIGHVH